LVIAVPASWINRRLLSLPPLVYIGKISYSWYLCIGRCWLCCAFFTMGLRRGRLRSRPLPPHLLLRALLHLIEQLFRRSTRLPIPLLLRYAAASALLLGACTFIWLTHGVPRRFPALAGMEAAGQALSADPCLAAETDRPT